MHRSINLLIIPALFCAGCAANGDGNVVNDAEVPTAPATPRTGGDDAGTGETYQVLFETSKGDFVIEVHEDWAPRGAARFRELVEAGFYDDCRFFRVIDGFMAQVGMNGDPQVQAQWQHNTIRDDPVRQSNTRGRVSFATSGPDSRTAQFFINFGDNSNLDPMGFSPIGEVIAPPADLATDEDRLYGMACVDGLYSGYGEGAPRGRGPDQGMILEQGNEYLNARFPELDYIVSARILEDEPTSPSDDSVSDESP